jgi:AsnC-type helix-turn-helix domain
MHEDDTVLDKIDLKIINSLIGDCRSPYRNIAERVGITPNAVKTRVNKMISGNNTKFCCKNKSSHIWIQEGMYSDCSTIL